MTGWLILAVYLVGAFITWRRAAWVLANATNTGDGDPSGEEVAFGLFFGLFAAALWPILVPCYLLWQRGKITGRHGLLRAPKQIRQKTLIDDQARRIKALEDELGITAQRQTEERAARMEEHQLYLEREARRFS